MTPMDAGEFAGLAAQYGPFFFSVIFVLFVPILGQKWFAWMLQARIRNGADREEALKVFRLYFVSGVATGLVLVGVSITWWLFVQVHYVLPNQDATFETKISEAIKKRIFEGTITNVSQEDMFIEGGPNPEYHLYVRLIENQQPQVYRYVIIFQQDPKKDSLVVFPYMTRTTFRNISSGSFSGFPEMATARIPLCPKSDITELPLVHSSSSPPHFDIKCDVQ